MTRGGRDTAPRFSTTELFTNFAPGPREQPFAPATLAPEPSKAMPLLRALPVTTNHPLPRAFREHQPPYPQPDHSPCTDPYEPRFTEEPRDLVASWRLRVLHPNNPPKGHDVNEYAPWMFAIDEKINTDWPLYPSEAAKIRYALS